MPLEIKRIVNAPIDSNCYIIYDKSQSEECIIIDPGSEHNDELINFLAQNSLIPKFIILTHEHFDHCWGVNGLREQYPGLKLVCSSICSEAIQNPKATYSHYYCKPEFRIEPADILVEDIMFEQEWYGYKLQYDIAKGHSTSGIFVFIENVVFTGDTLIRNNKNITKYKTGSQSELEQTFQKMLMHKGEGLIVYPGHGDTLALDDCDLREALNRNKV